MARARRKGVSIQVSGASKELLCCVDLLDRGHQAFRALAPDAPFDVVALVGERLLRIQVTAGHWDPNGRLRYDKHEGGRHDVVGVVVRGKVHYVPDLFKDNPKPPAAARKRRALEVEIKTVFAEGDNAFEIAYERGWQVWLIKQVLDPATFKRYRDWRNVRKKVEYAENAAGRARQRLELVEGKTPLQ